MAASSQQTSTSKVTLPSLKQYPALVRSWLKLPDKEKLSIAREWAREDLYFLLRFLLRRTDCEREWVFDRCREVQESPYGNLDLWARFHYKSTIITFGHTIQEILRNPEITIGIFSHTRPIAKAFLRQIKREFEQNDWLKACFPDVLYADPAKQSPKWSEDDGLIVRRDGNPKECTLEAWGLVDGMPVGKHFNVLKYDDIVTKDSVTNPEMIAKTTDALRLSYALGSEECDKAMIGTRYNMADSYDTVLKDGTFRPRIYPATHDGTYDGKPVLISQERLDGLKVDMADYIFACHCAGTKVLMADWSYKNIEDIEAGESVVGFNLGAGKGKKPKLVATKVIASHKRRSEANRYTLEGGATVSCTPDHKWWTKHSGRDHHRVYAPLGNLKGKNLNRLARISNCQTHEPQSLEEHKKWAYLSGLMDGEGTVGNRGQVVITQSHEHNPEICERLVSVLNDLRVPFSTYVRPAHTRGRKNSKASTLFILRGGRSMKHRLLLNGDPAKRAKLTASLYGHLGGKSETVVDRVLSFEALGEQDVYNIQTETGNYIAGGYASKNCQMLLSPIAGSEHMFDINDLETYEVRPHTLNAYLLIDPARSRKKDSANTAMVVLGMDYAGNKYLLDGVNHRMDLQERWQWLRTLYLKWIREPGIQSVKVGYEKFGALADLDYFQEKMNVEKLSIPIEELAWPKEGDGSKIDRVQRLGPDIRSHRFYLPHPTTEETLSADQRKMTMQGAGYRVSSRIRRKDSEGNLYDVAEQLKLQIHYFPFGGLKDLVDAASRIYDIEATVPVYIEESSLEPEFL